MKAQDLRIGNIIKYTTGEIGKVVATTEYTEYEVAIDQDRELLPMSAYAPIDLTPEILEKCGFACFNDIEFIVSISGGQLHLFLNDDNDNFIKWYPKGVNNDGYWMPFNGKYLHDLQNTVHALTGNELDVKM